MLFETVAHGGPTFFQLAPLVVFIPLLGATINFLFGRRLGERGVATVAVTAAGTAFLISVLQWLSLRAHPEGATQVVVEWITIGDFQVRWAQLIDTLSVTMMLVVSGVGTLIHIYATAYMHYDVRYKNDPRRYARFFGFFNLFIAMMMILVTGDSYLTLFVGWEGVGLCSFLLIGFWYEYDILGRPSTANARAAKKAFVVNRVGDFGFLLAIFTLFWYFGTVEFHGVFAKVHEVAAAHPQVLLAVTLFLLLGVTGKSAQIPLFVWLPDAMAGPTPVSALIHAATMVTAGVYLITRSAELYMAVPQAQAIVALVGGLTALVAATMAVAQYDIKKVLAYSTISQLGFMVAAVGMGAFVAGMFHLVTHAFFKALLFLGSGSVIIALERAHHPLPDDPEAQALAREHGHGGHDAHGHDDHEHGHEPFDPQDMRNMGGLLRRIPVTSWTYIIGGLALAGIPPLAGFWSKDEILLEAKHLQPVVYGLLTAAAFLTAFYVTRQLVMVFLGRPRSEAAAHAIESPKAMTGVLVTLAGLSLVGGFLNAPGVHAFAHWLEHTLPEVETLPFDLVVASVSTGLALLSMLTAWSLYKGVRAWVEWQQDPLERILGPGLFGFLHHAWHWDDFYQAVFVRGYDALAAFLAHTVDWAFWHDWFHETIIAGTYRRLSRFLAWSVDLGVIDRLANELAGAVKGLALVARKLQSGYVRNYALSVFVGVVLMLGYLLWVVR
ncbi:MAG: NADH-quinone oxidoreductase subunit L [Chloroflexi bacterium]|nr:NADH-quinone oxidoreductase subunit L [Chloroflexota bacterium]